MREWADGGKRPCQRIEFLRRELSKEGGEPCQREEASKGGQAPCLNEEARPPGTGWFINPTKPSGPFGSSSVIGKRPEKISHTLFLTGFQVSSLFSHT